MDDEIRINVDGDYMIIAPDPDVEGYSHYLTERVYLVDNLLNFLKQHPNIKPCQVTIYELKEVNERRISRLLK